MVIDTHAHLDDVIFKDDRKQIIDNFSTDNLESVICASYDFESMQNAFNLSQNNKSIYCALGVHPENASEYCDNIEKFIIKNSNNSKVVAIGEIGLDYHYDNTNKELQKKVFIKQIMLAHKLKLPVIIHVRDSVEDSDEILNKYKQCLHGGVMHCFSSSYEMAQKFIDLGLYIGFGGVITFKNARKSVEVVEKLGLNHVLLETDCPYLCPEPNRGKRNEPKYTNIVAQKIAQIVELPLEDVEKITTKNAKQCFAKIR